MIVALLVLSNVLLLALAIPMTLNVVRAKRAKREVRALDASSIPRCRIDHFDAAFVPGEFGPTPAAEVAFIGRWTLESSVIGGTSDLEAWILAVLAKRAMLMFEFGTATGKTAYLWARNSPAGARVVTMTLPPAAHGAYQPATGDDPEATQNAVRESMFERFLYTGTDVEGKVTQLFGDSKTFDETPYRDACDLIFVDGSHAYSYVVNDTHKALRMVRPGGVILWHDYAGPKRQPDVYRALNDLSDRLPLVRLDGTMLVAYRRPPDHTVVAA